jgi:hypothetical protein
MGKFQEHLSNAYREIGCYFTLFTFLVVWHTSAVRMHPVGVIFVQLACPLNDIIFCLHQE